jgi:hypothetical protein
MVKRGGIQDLGPGAPMVFIAPPITRLLLEALAKFDCQEVSMEVDGGVVHVSATIKLNQEESE